MSLSTSRIVYNTVQGLAQGTGPQNHLSAVDARFHASETGSSDAHLFDSDQSALNFSLRHRKRVNNVTGWPLPSSNPSWETPKQRTSER